MADNQWNEKMLKMIYKTRLYLTDDEISNLVGSEMKSYLDRDFYIFGFNNDINYINLITPDENIETNSLRLICDKLKIKNLPSKKNTEKKICVILNESDDIFTIVNLHFSKIKYVF